MTTVAAPTLTLTVILSAAVGPPLLTIPSAWALNTLPAVKLLAPICAVHITVSSAVLATVTVATETSLVLSIDLLWATFVI